MSLTELEAEISSLSAGELKALQAAVEFEMLKKENGAPVDMGQFLGCTRGMMTFHPGREEDEPLVMWEALRDDSSV